MIDAVKERYDFSNKLPDAATKNKTNIANDQTLITMFNKMTDPTSVVRESEYARTGEDMALWSRVKGYFGKMKMGGAGLTDMERKDLINAIEAFGRVSDKIYKEKAMEFRTKAEKYDLDPDNIIVYRPLYSDDRQPASGTPSKQLPLDHYLNLVD